MKRIYFDNAATTAVSKEVLEEMLPCFNISYGNSSSVHSFGREAEAIVDLARDRISKEINTEKSNEIFFTSGGTEANNFAIKGIARAYCKKGKHIISTQIEHDSVLSSLHFLENEGFKVTYLKVNKNGLISLDNLKNEICKDTILISIMFVNNEIGTIQNIKEIAKIAHEKNIIFHSDAVQALGAIKINVRDLKIDAMSLSSHKINGPKGAGALYLKNGIKIENLIHGGSQESEKRGGTINVPAVAGFGKAVQSAGENREVNQAKIMELRELFLKKLSEKKVNYKINGSLQNYVPNIINVSFDNYSGEEILQLLDMKGIAVSTGAACSSHTIGSSHVLQSLSLTEDEVKNSVRFSFSKDNTEKEIIFAVEKIAQLF